MEIRTAIVILCILSTTLAKNFDTDRSETSNKRTFSPRSSHPGRTALRNMKKVTLRHSCERLTTSEVLDVLREGREDFPYVEREMKQLRRSLKGKTFLCKLIATSVLNLNSTDDAEPSSGDDEPTSQAHDLYSEDCDDCLINSKKINKVANRKKEASKKRKDKLKHRGTRIGNTNRATRYQSKSNHNRRKGNLPNNDIDNGGRRDDRSSSHTLSRRRKYIKNERQNSRSRRHGYGDGNKNRRGKKEARKFETSKNGIARKREKGNLISIGKKHDEKVVNKRQLTGGGNIVEGLEVNDNKTNKRHRIKSTNASRLNPRSGLRNKRNHKYD